MLKKVFRLRQIALNSRQDIETEHHNEFRHLLLQSSWPKALANPLFLEPGSGNHCMLGKLNKENRRYVFILCSNKKEKFETNVI